MAKEFKEGEIVELKSGGPKMTVEGYSVLETEVYCTWFAGAKLQNGTFSPDSLKRIADEENTSK